MPSFLIYGNDFLVAKEAKEIANTYGAHDVLEGNKTVFDSSNFDMSQFQQVSQALPFMDSVRLLVLEDVIKNNTSIGTSIIQHLPHLPESTLLIIKEHSDKINSSMSKASAKELTVKNLVGPKSNRELHQWIKEQTLNKNLPISPSGITALAHNVGVNLWSIDNELEKLSLYTQGRQITDVEVKELVHASEEINLFGTIDAIIEKKRGTAFHNISALLTEGHDTNSILRLIGRQLRLIAISKYLSSTGYSHTDIKQKMGVSSNFVLNKILAQSSQVSQESLLYMFEQLVKTDTDIKTGVLDSSIAIDMFLNYVT